MGLHYANLDNQTRLFMLQEIATGGHYLSPRLNSGGQGAWPALMEEAANRHIDDWIARQLLDRRYLCREERFVRKGSAFFRKINQPQAAQMLAEGEFNRYYLRGLCLRAQAAGRSHLLIYRGKAVASPRPESEAKIGSLIALPTFLSIFTVSRIFLR